jgi:hypothetical protein
MTFDMRPLLPGYVLALLAIIVGFGLGVAFGSNEEAMKADLASKAHAARHLYADEAAVKKVLDKSWTYYQRAHLHASSLGTTALVLITLVGLLGIPKRLAVAIGIALGLGSLGYGLFWLFAGMAAPMLGSTSLAKASYEWLGAGAPALLMISVFVVLGATVITWVKK